MAFDWKEFLKLAKFLKNCDDESVTREACLRSAVSRVYFAAYGHALDYACDKLKFVKTGYKDHKNLRNTYLDNNRRAIATPLQRLRDNRNHCDYDDEIENIEIIVKSSIKDAEKIFGKLGT